MLETIAHFDPGCMMKSIEIPDDTINNRKAGTKMNILRSPVFFFVMFLVAGHLIQADSAFSVPPMDIPNCMAPCTEQYKACFDKVKDSPNDIERTLCSDEKKECEGRCNAETKELTKQYQQQVLQEQQERVQQGLSARPTAEEREVSYEKADEEKQERKAQAEREEQERREKEAQEKLKTETINGEIKILKLD